MKRPWRDYAVLALVAGLIILADQLTKAYVRANLNLGEMWAPWDWLLPYARIVHWYNTGVAFGMLKGLGNIFAVFSALVAAAIIYYYPQVPVHDRMLRAAMCMQLGGAVGNLIDRIAIGHVTDFISVGSFPVFNIADSSITVGVAVMVLGVYLQERRQKALDAQSAQAAPQAVDQLPATPANEDQKLP